MLTAGRKTMPKCHFAIKKFERDVIIISVAAFLIFRAGMTCYFSTQKEIQNCSYCNY